MKYKLYTVQIDDVKSAISFLEWLTQAEPPLQIMIGSMKYTFDNETQKLFWMAGFEAMLPIEYEN